MGKSQELYKEAKTLIPGGTQLLSKRPEMFLPGLWPAYYDKAKGCEVWDLDGNKYIDMSYMGIGANILGYSDDYVNTAVKNAIDNSSMCTLNAPEEVELAKLMIENHPWANMVRYSKTGGEAMAIAVRIARAKTDKDIVLFCGYHGWHDWYLSANLTDGDALNDHLLTGLKPKGVPKGLIGTSFPFEYNNTEKFLALVEKYKGKIAAVVVESIRNKYPENNFLETIRKVTTDNGIVFIMDEVSSGLRLNVGGAHLELGVNPDIAVFGKAISNGYPMSIILGRRDVMDAAQDSFISSTYWTDRIGLVASLATLKRVKELDVPKHINEVGKKIQNGWKELADKHGLNIDVSGIYPLSHFSFKEKPLVLKTLFIQFMLEKGILASNSFYASFAHKEHHVEEYLKAVDLAFEFIANALKDNPEKYLKDEVCQSGFKRLT